MSDRHDTPAGADEPRPDAAFLREFISTIYGKDFSGAIVLWSKQTKQTRLFDSSSIDALVAAVGSLSGHEDLYLGLATQPTDLPPRKRGGNGTVVQARAFFADIDCATEKPGNKNYPRDEDEALRVLDEFEHRPTFVQRSGAGLHAIWLYGEPIECGVGAERKRAANIAKGLDRKLSEHCKKYGREIVNRRANLTPDRHAILTPLVPGEIRARADGTDDVVEAVRALIGVRPGS